MQENVVVPIVDKVWPYGGLATREMIWFHEICSRFSGSFLNIGIAGGSSTIIMGYASPNTKIDSVDMFSKYVEHGVLHDYGPSKVKYLKNLKDNNLEGRVTNYFMSSEEFFKQNNSKYNLIFVDGGHDYEVALLDIKNAWDRLNDNGALLIHDFIAEDFRTDKRSEPGVTQAVWEFFGGKVLDYEVHESLLTVYKIPEGHSDNIRNIYHAKATAEHRVND